MKRRVRLRICFRRRSDLALLLTLAMLVTGFLGYLAWGQQEVAASGWQAPLAAASGMREYYVTKGTYGGANASTACASGYHMASLWEILDPSNLQYNTTLGYTREDSGAGPPAIPAWMRTGYASNNGATAGRANCNSWSTTVGSGTVARLPLTWDLGLEDLYVWDVQTYGCSTTAHVWCVADDVEFEIYLPIVLREFP